MRIDGTRYNFSKDYKNNTDNAGAEDLTTALGAIIGAMLSGSVGGLYQYIVEQYNIDNGIWFDIVVRGHVNVFGHKIYYMLPPFLWHLDGYGAQ